MTIEYKDSKRITALSTDVVETLDYSDDFSSDGYTDVGSNVGVSNGKMKFTNTAGGDNRSHKSLGITLDSNFISRFEYKRLSTTSGNIPTYPVVFTATNSDPEADNDFIAIRVDSGGTAYLTVDDGTTNTVTSGITISNDVNYFIELKREGTTSYLSIKTGSHTGSDISGSPVNLSTPTSVTGLTTVQHAVKSNQTGGSYNAEIDNLEIYNGETSLTSKPSNVQDNSLLVEKDTARRYWFDEALAPTFEDDFSSDNWTDNDSTNIGVSGGALTWSMKRDNTNDASVRDLTSTSDNWVLRFKVTQGSSIGSTGAGNGFFFGISDSDQSVAQNGNQDFVGMAYYYDNQSEYNAMDCDGASLPHLYQGDAGQNFNITANDVFYFEIIKNGSSYTVEGFTNSDYSTGSLGQISGTTTATGLRYLKIMNELSNGSISTSTSPFNGTIDDVEFYNGVTTVTPATWLLGKSHISKSGCLIYYNFEQTSGNLINQATTANGFADGLGSTGDGTSSGTVGKSNTGKVGSNAWSFDGSSGKTASSNSSDLILTGDVSWVGWIKIDSSTSTGAPTIFSVRGAAGNAQVDNALFCGYVSKNTSPIDLIVFHEHDAGTNVSPAVNINTNLSTGVWYHFAVTRDVSEKQYSVYIDGSLLSTHTYNTNPNTTATSLDFELGHTDADDYFDGMLDEVSLWNRVLTADEISALYNSGYGVII